MKKEIGDLTLRELKEICFMNTNYFQNCYEDCPLKDICGTSKHIRCLSDNLDQEIEVEE